MSGERFPYGNYEPLKHAEEINEFELEVEKTQKKYDKWLEMLDQAAADGDEKWAETCRRMVKIYADKLARKLV